MCTLCLEIQKELVNPSQVNKLYKELILSDGSKESEKHLDFLSEILDNITQSYKEEIDNAIQLEDFDDDGGDFIDF